MDSNEGTSWRFPTDVFAEILLRVPPNSRRRLRLVCRLWRDVVDERTFPHTGKILFVPEESSAFVVDEQTGRRRDLWTSSTPPRCRGMRIVGTRNGLVCLCDDAVPGGAITLANPVTGETLDVPPPPLPPPPQCVVARRDQRRRWSWRWHQAYGFGYHPTTGRYKVVHVPCRFDDHDHDLEFHALQVFTLGETSWQDVETPTPVPEFDFDAGIVDIGGTTYWATITGAIMSLDLEDGRVARIMSSQPMCPGPGSRVLAEVQGKLGVVFRVYTLCLSYSRSTSLSVFVWDDGEWRRWYSIEVSPSRNPRGQQRLTHPRFALESDHILTWGSASGYGGLYKHKPFKSASGAWGGLVEIKDSNQGWLVADITSRFDTLAFSYVETRESLSVYSLGDSFAQVEPVCSEHGRCGS